jgi:membrane associated rhomboid family serine protease
MADFRMRGFQDIPPVIKNLVIINVLMWLAELVFGENFVSILSLHYYKSEEFELWQPVTYMFLHAPDMFLHILFNMLMLWMFGATLENLWGAKRFLIFYILCGIGAGVIQMAASAVEMNVLLNHLQQGKIAEAEFIERGRNIYHGIALGASGAVMGVMVGFAYTFPNMPLYIFPLPVPIKAKYMVMGYVLIDLFSGINPQYNTGIAHFAHVGGALIGLILVMTMNKNNRRTFY